MERSEGKGSTVEKKEKTSETPRIIELNDSNFKKYLKNSNKIFLIDFWAEWCAPCKMMEQPFHDLSKKYPKIQFCRMNVDMNRRIAMRYNIQSIPRFVFFKNGNPIHQVVGAVGEGGLEHEIQRVLKTYPNQ
ncbi:MAG: thioredoxin [Candidatus Lokiarchaeota archaeon]|nr:thioredoxin [Candidatus Lokiarchaeota archaeon]